MEYGNNKTKDRISNERELDEGKTASQTDGWVVQEKETQPKLAQRRETERLVEFGVGTGFCGVLRVHYGVKHLRK